MRIGEELSSVDGFAWREIRNRFRLLPLGLGVHLCVEHPEVVDHRAAGGGRIVRPNGLDDRSVCIGRSVGGQWKR